jgi:signal transduction histidine kinase
MFMACSEAPVPKSEDERLLITEALSKVSELMTEGEFEIAQEEIGKIYKAHPLLLEYPEIQYYLLCFESEIFYYNAVFTLGADKASEALSYCKSNFINDSNRIGNAWNLLGINSEKFLQAEAAIAFYQKAEENLGTHQNPLLSKRYHVLSNLGQLYLKVKRNSDAIKLLNASNRICQNENIYRTLSINHIALSRVYSDSGLIMEANSHYDSAFNYSKNDERDDLKLFLLTQKARLLWKAGQSKEAELMLRQTANDSIHNTALSMGLFDFYQESVALLSEMGAYNFASELSLKKARLQDQTLDKTNALRERIISRHFKNQETILAQRQDQRLTAQTLKTQRNTILMLSGLFIALILLVLFWIFNYTQRKKLEKSLAQIEAILSERDRISRDFHDGIAPNLSTIKLICEAVVQNPQKTELIASMPILVDQTIDEIRRMVIELSPRLIIEHGLHFAVAQLLEHLQSASNIQFTLKSNIENKRYAAKIELNIYRILQEAINNAIKHSASKVIGIELHEFAGKLTLMVSDHGSNTENKIGQNGSGNGMGNMKSRVELMQGEMEIKSERNKGTKLKIVVPLFDA